MTQGAGPFNPDINVKPLAVCAIFKNEAPNLLEWIAFHSAIGFDRFVLYDNGSDDGGARLIRHSRFADRAMVIHWPQRPGQLAAYQHFIDCFDNVFEWAAFLDLDEYLLPERAESIVESLPLWRDFAAVLPNWRCFGPNNLTDPPPGLTIESYTMRLEDAADNNRHVKTLAKCSALRGIGPNPHVFQLAGKACDTLGREVSNVALQPAACHANLAINHYVTRSKSEWDAKLRKGNATIGRADTAPEPLYAPDVFDNFVRGSTVHDTAAMRFAPRVRALLVAASTASPDAARQGAPAGGPPISAAGLIGDPGVAPNRLPPGGLGGMPTGGGPPISRTGLIADLGVAPYALPHGGLVGSPTGGPPSSPVGRIGSGDAVTTPTTLSPPPVDPSRRPAAGPPLAIPGLVPAPAITRTDPARVNVAARLVHLDPGTFLLSVPPPAQGGSAGVGEDLPALRASTPPAPRDTFAGASVGARLSIDTWRGDGWLIAGDEPALIRVPPPGADLLLSLYWSPARDAGPPAFALTRSGLDATSTRSPSAPAATPPPASIPAGSAEIVAHIQGFGDRAYRFGQWAGEPSSGRAIEGFSLALPGLNAGAFEIRGVLGRDWFSPWLPGTQFCGSRGLGLPLRGFQLRPRGAPSPPPVSLRARFIDGTEIGPLTWHQPCAAASLAPLEAFKIDSGPSTFVP